MSGESSGLIVLPLLFGGLPLLLGGLAVAGVAYAARGAVRAATGNSQRRQQQTQRPMINTRGVDNRIGNFRSEMNEVMNTQARLNQEASQQMMYELETQRANLQRVAQQNDIMVYQEYIDKLKDSRTQTMQNIYKVQNDFNLSYKRQISETMAIVTENINKQYETYMNELQQLRSDMVIKNQKAQKIAQTYIQEAQSLLKSLADDFEGHKYSSRQIVTLSSQLNQSIDLYNKGRYESALASSKDVAVNTLEEIFEADARKQEWENYYHLALVLSEEVKNFIEAQGTITQEVKEYAENALGKPLQDDIVGIKISDYTDKNSKGQTRYDYIFNKANELYNALRAENASQLTTDQLKECISFLNNNLYPQTSQCISKGIINMNNAFSRQNMSEEIIDFFEEHNFMFNGYAYENDCHDKALHIGLENEATGEELIITLAPEVLQDGDIQTKVDLKQIKGDEANEERKAYYRECIENVVKGNNPYAKVDIKCNTKTRNKLSTDNETKKKLKSE